jgi:glycosyltransferase involved in cell wall biosynthesis
MERARSGPLRVLFVGQLTQRKGIAYLFDALQDLDPTQYKLTLVGPVIGSGRWLNRFEGRYQHVLGMRRIDMPDVYRDHDVLVLPSLVEGSALVVGEAMASGLPVVVTPNAGSDAVRDGIDGFIVPVRNPEAIASRLELLHNDGSRLAAMGVAARRRAEEFTWSSFQDGIRKLIQERAS